MPRTTLRRLGSTAFAVGLLLASIGVVAGGSSTAGAADATGTDTVPICNNQRSSTPDTNCQGDALHGTVTTSYDADGNLVFDVLATADGFVGWSGIKICIPQVGPTDGADCTGADGPISPAVYTVTGADGVVENDKDVSFTCDGDFRATVDAAVVDGDDAPSFTVHLTACADGAAGGATGTDEAFGTATRPSVATTTTSSTTTSSTSTTPTTVPATTTTTSTTSTTVPASTTTTPTTAAPTLTATPGGPTDAVVLGEQLVRPAVPAAAVAPAVAVTPSAAVAPAELPRTGSSTAPLVELGLGLTLAGALVLLGARRSTPQPARHALPADGGRPVVLPATTATAGLDGRTRPLLLTAALLTLGAALGRRRP
jgi:hypothetical protein